MKLQIKKGSTDVSTLIFVQDSSATTGVGLDGLAYDTASLTCYYCRPGSAAAALSLATQTVTGAHSDGGFVEIDSTNMPGVYRLDLSDAILASGVDSVVVFLHGAANMAPVPIEIELVAYDPQDTVRLGLTAMPNAAADAAGGLPISDAGGLDLDTVGSNVAAVLVDTGTTLPATLTTVEGKIDTVDTVVDAVLVDTGAMEPKLGAPAVSLSADIAAVKVDTAATLVDTANMQPKLGTPSADISADIAAIKSDTAATLTDTGTTLPATLTTIEGKIDTVDTEVGVIDGIVDTILVDTNEIQGKLPTGDIADESSFAAIEADTQDIQGRLPAALASGRIVADAQAISTSTDAADKLEASAETMVIGTVSHDNTAATTTEFYSDDITEATADHYNGRIVLFTSGALVGQATDITDYVLSAGEGHFTVTALTEAPADNVTFVIV